MSTPVVFIHAFPLDSTMWATQLQAFPGALAPDLPGFGSSAGDMTQISLGSTAVVSAMDAAGVDAAIVCGLSMGGYVALDIWRSHPERVRGLILANTRAEADDDAGRQKRRDLAARLRAEGSGFLVDSPPPLLSEEASSDLREEVRQIIAAQPAGSIAAASEAMAERSDSTADLPGITVPVLVINSSADSLIPADITARIAQGVAGASLETIQGAGHLSNMQAPARFNDLVQAHLARC